MTPSVRLTLVLSLLAIGGCAGETDSSGHRPGHPPQLEPPPGGTGIEIMGIPIPLGGPSGSSATAGDVPEDEEVPSAQNEGANPINHQPVQQGETAHETGPIVVASPETLPYNGSATAEAPIPALPTVPTVEKVGMVVVSGSSYAPGRGIMLVGYVENKEGQRLQTPVEIGQDSDSPPETVQTDPNGFFGTLIDTFDATTSEVDGKEIAVARFYLQAVSVGPEGLPLGEETVIEVSLEGIYLGDEKQAWPKLTPETPPIPWNVVTLAEPEEAHKVYVLPVLKPVHKPFLTLVPLTPKKPHIAEIKTPLLIPGSFLPEEKPEDHPLPSIKPLWFEGIMAPVD